MIPDPTFGISFDVEANRWNKSSVARIVRLEFKRAKMSWNGCRRTRFGNGASQIHGIDSSHRNHVFLRQREITERKMDKEGKERVEIRTWFVNVRTEGRSVGVREKGERAGAVISVQIAKLRRHCAVIARSELSRSFSTFMTPLDLRFIYATDSSL